MKKSLLLSLAGVCFSVFGAPVFCPEVKEYKPGTGVSDVQGAPIYHEAQRQCEIAASEIPCGGKICKGFSDVSSPGIYIATAASPEGKQLIRSFEVDVPKKKQGYVIAVKDGRVAIVGFDPIGALYGAVTLRQMIEDGKIANAVVRDYPDILYRGSMSFGRGIGKLNRGERGVAGFKAGIDMLLRHKMNLISDYHGVTFASSKGVFARIAECNRYAEERGFYCNLYPHTALWTRENRPADVTPENWKCVADLRRWGDNYHCWADDEQTRAAAERYAELVKKMGINRPLLVIHPVDGGFLTDPEMWSRRCSKCRERWKDNERWKASVRQLEIWNEVLKKHFPEGLIGSCVYPYKIGLLRQPEDQRDDIFRQNVTDYWKNLSDGLDRNFFFSSWITSPVLLKPYRDLIGSRPLHFSDTYPQSAGIFSTYHRFAGNAYEADSENIFATRSTDIWGCWESMLLAAEHTWNKDAPGSEFYGIDTVYYDGLKDHIGPEVIMEKTLPRICHTFWGKELAPYMTKIMASGLTPKYIAKPGETVLFWDKVRRDSLYDPNVKGSSIFKNKLAPIIDSPELMLKQVEAAELVVKQLKEAEKHLTGTDRFKRKYFMYFAKYAPFWLAAARAQYNIRMAGKLLGAGKNKEAADFLSNADKELKADYDAAEQNWERLKNEPDTESAGKKIAWALDRKIMQKRLDDALESAKVVLEPRRIGRFIKIGITNGKSAKGTKEYFDGFSNVRATIIDGISIKELDKYDCIFCTSNSYEKDSFFRDIAAYVNQGGGGVFLEGPLCGHERFDTRTPFPNIVKTSPQRVDNFQRQLQRTDGKTGQSMYVDYFTLVPGPEGETLVKSLSGEPVIVRGKSGAGKVVFCGTFNIEAQRDGFFSAETKLFGINAEIAKEAVEYFTGLKLKEK